jgi:hypothetical protein
MLGGARRDHGSLPSACTSAAAAAGGWWWLLLHTVIDEYLFRMLPSIPPAPTRSKRFQYLGTKYLKKDERFSHLTQQERGMRTEAEELLGLSCRGHDTQHTQSECELLVVG